MNLSDLIEAYHQWGQRNRELMGNVPGLVPLMDFMGDIANTPGVGMAIPAAGPYGLPIKERLGALMESPTYFDVPLKSRLALLKGAPPQRTQEFQRLLSKYGGYNKGVRLSDILSKKEPHQALLPEDWVNPLLKGSGRR